MFLNNSGRERKEQQYLMFIQGMFSKGDQVLSPLLLLSSLQLSLQLACFSNAEE